MSEYTEQAEKFLTDHGLQFRAVLIGSDCPTFCEDAEHDRAMNEIDKFPRKTHIHGKHYRCTFSGEGRGHVNFDFWNSYADEEFNVEVCKFTLGTALAEINSLRLSGAARNDARINAVQSRKPKTTTAYDVLACLTKSDPGSFENFCGEFGYNTDSRKAEEVYRAVVKEWGKVQKFFRPAEIEKMREIA